MMMMMIVVSSGLLQTQTQIVQYEQRHSVTVGRNSVLQRGLPHSRVDR